MERIQIAKEIYLMNLSIMKKILDLISFKYDNRTSEFKYMKKQIMDYFYNTLNNKFKSLEDSKILKKCECGTNVRKGYKNCSCGGAGFINAK